MTESCNEYSIAEVHGLTGTYVPTYVCVDMELDGHCWGYDACMWATAGGSNARGWLTAYDTC